MARRAVLTFSIWNRRRKAELIGRFMDAHNIERVAVVGGLGSGEQPNESVVERLIAERAEVVAMLEIAMPVVPPWPDVIGDGRALPLRAGSVDLVLSNAVIEHVGDEQDQAAYMAEHLRVGRTWIVTTPNRWFPVESHTSAVLRHWSPRWRARRGEFTRLMSRSELRRLLPPDAVVVGHWWSPTFVAMSEP